MAEPSTRVRTIEQTKAQSVQTTTGRVKAKVELDKALPATYTTYRTIRKHPTIALARALAMAPVVAATWHLESDDEVDDERVKFIDSQIMPIRETLLMQAMGDTIDYGWSPYEKIFGVKTIGGRKRIVLHKLKPLLVDLTDILVNPDDGSFEGLRQGSKFGDDIDLDPMYTLVINMRVEGTNWYGQSLLENVRYIFQNWRDANDGAERYDRKVAGTCWVVYYPVGTTMVNGVSKANDEIAGDIIEALEASGSVAVPAEIRRTVEDLNSESGHWKIDLQDHNAKQYSFVARLQYIDSMFARGLLMPERAVQETKFGTKAEAGVHSDLAIVQRELEHRQITRQIQKYLVDPLIEFNYGPDAVGSVRLVADPLVDSDKAFLQDVYKAVMAHPTASVEFIEEVDLDGLMEAIQVPKLRQVALNPDPAGIRQDPSGGEPGNLQDRMQGMMGRLYAAANGNGRLPKAVTVNRVYG